MLKCSYILLVFNNEKTIAKVIESLKKINDNLRKEFIILDDGSTDDSLNIIKEKGKFLNNMILLSHARNLGTSISLNEALSLVRSDYIFFLDGRGITNPSAASTLINACQMMKTEVATSRYDSSKNPLDASAGKIILLDAPIEIILENKKPGITPIGMPGSLISSKLLEKIGGPNREFIDKEIYTCSLSLSLKCAEFSKFALVEEKIVEFPDGQGKREAKFETYNLLKSIYNFTKGHPELMENYRAALLSFLLESIENKNNKFFYYLQSLAAKYTSSPSLNQILDYYRQTLEDLF